MQRVLNKGFEGGCIADRRPVACGGWIRGGGGWESGAGTARATDEESKPAKLSVRSRVVGSSPGQ